MGLNKELKPGDIFLTENQMIFGRAVSYMQRVRAKDDQAKYSHSGIILDAYGTTFETLQTIRSDSLLYRYRGKSVLIARYKKMDNDRFQSGQDKVSSYAGNWYPAHRLLLHLLNISKYVHWDSMVCSELVARFLHFACRNDGIFEFEHYFGYAPDDLHDIFRRQSDFEIIYNGTI